MKFAELNDLTQNKGFGVFDSAELVVGINAPGCASYSRKDLDKLTDWVKRPQIGAKGLVYLKINEDGSSKSSVDKFYTSDDKEAIIKRFSGKPGDLILILSGDTSAVRKQLSELRLEMGSRLDLRKPDEYKVLWVLDFPLLEYDKESNRWHAMHHPFTSPKPEDLKLIDSDPGKVRAKRLRYGYKRHRSRWWFRANFRKTFAAEKYSNYLVSVKKKHKLSLVFY